MDVGSLTKVRTGVTLVVLLVVVLVAVVWGWRSLTEPLPSSTEGPCTAMELAAGDTLYPDQVTVAVLNAGTRNGLASRTMSELAEQGFPRGELANAPGGTDVRTAAIWTDQPSSAAVRLVRSYLGRGRTDVVRRDPTSVGVNVVVGDGFDDLRKGSRKVKVSEATTVCSPPS